MAVFRAIKPAYFVTIDYGAEILEGDDADGMPQESGVSGQASYV